MGAALQKLLSFASESLGPQITPENCRTLLEPWGALGGELGQLLAMRNGFYGFESALLVRPLAAARAPLGISEWNAPSLWKGQYTDDLSEALFFAEDIFGGQFCLCQDQVCTFEPETGELAALSESLEGWAEEVLAEYEVLTGYPLAHEWQVTSGKLAAGIRLLPKTPFVCGGAFELANLYALSDVEGMTLRASLANQIRDLPDGAEIQFKIVP